MKSMTYVGLDVHKKTIAYCVTTRSGKRVEEGTVCSTRSALGGLVSRLRRPWTAALEATLFTGWIYDFLVPHAAAVQVAHPAMLKAIAASKKKNDRIDAAKIADLLRCDLLPQCYMAPEPVRAQRRVLRYRNLILSEATRMKNKIAGLLMETGTPYDERRLHGKGYFTQLVGGLEQTTPASVQSLLRISRSNMELFEGLQRGLLKKLSEDGALSARMDRLRQIAGVGEVLALTWALEVGDPRRFGSIGKAVSYCGLCSAQHNSAGREQRGPISKMRNPHLQYMLVEAAQLAPRWNAALRAVHERELKRGNKNRATLAVARKLVAYLLAADKSAEPFVPTVPDAPKA